MHQYLLDISWNNIFFGDKTFTFLLNVLIRTLAMFIILVVGIRLMGKRGVRQLSLFELVVIIGLGSAAGDPMFYEEVGILQAIVVFVTVIGLYRGITLLVALNPAVEQLLEGKPTKIIENGVFCINGFQKDLLGDDEYFAELRQKSITHLGQIKLAILETNGSISIFYFDENEVNFGLPVLPDLFRHKQKIITHDAFYSCSFCGFTTFIKALPTEKVCSNCKKKEWILSINEKRVM